MSVKLRVVELHPNDSYSKNSDVLRVGDVIEFDKMPEFDTWDIAEIAPAALRVVNGFDYTDNDCSGTNLRTGKWRRWCFHAVKFERV